MAAAAISATPSRLSSSFASRAAATALIAGRFPAANLSESRQKRTHSALPFVTVGKIAASSDKQP